MGFIKFPITIIYFIYLFFLPRCNAQWHWTGDLRCANAYIRTHTHTHRMKKSSNTLKIGSISFCTEPNDKSCPSSVVLELRRHPKGNIQTSGTIDMQKFDAQGQLHNCMPYDASRETYLLQSHLSKH